MLCTTSTVLLHSPACLPQGFEQREVMRMGITLQTFACTCWLAVGMLAEWGPENGYRSAQPTLHTPSGCVAQDWELTGGQRTGN